MPARGSSWVQCISARLEPPKVNIPQLRNSQPPPPRKRPPSPPKNPKRTRWSSSEKSLAAISKLKKYAPLYCPEKIKLTLIKHKPGASKKPAHCVYGPHPRRHSIGYARPDLIYHMICEVQNQKAKAENIFTQNNMDIQCRL